MDTVARPAPIASTSIPNARAWGSAWMNWRAAFSSEGSGSVAGSG